MMMVMNDGDDDGDDDEDDKVALEDIERAVCLLSVPANVFKGHD